MIAALPHCLVKSGTQRQLRNILSKFLFSDYKPEYDKLRERKLKEAEKKKEGKTSDLPANVGELNG